MRSQQTGDAGQSPRGPKPRAVGGKGSGRRFDNAFVAVLAVGAAWGGAGCQAPPKKGPVVTTTQPVTTPAESVAEFRQTFRGQPSGVVKAVSKDNPNFAWIDDVEGGAFTVGDLVTIWDPTTRSIINSGEVFSIGEGSKRPIIKCRDSNATRPPALGDIVVRRPG